MRLRITSWNANSVRLRQSMLKRIRDEIDPDILCLQEIKVASELFPHEMFEALGYTHRLVHGQKAYHGVAVLSRIPLDGMVTHDWCGKEEARHLECRLPGGIELHNLYVPAGGDIPDVEQNPKFRHKLDMLDELRDWFARNSDDQRQILLLGDLNIAPHENDVWSHRQLLKVVSHTPVEVEKLAALQESHGFVDAIREIIPTDRKLYSWWSYRSRDWSASDRGRRLDHIWLSPALAPFLRDATITREARGWDQPSDHVPVTIDLDLPQQDD
ncbi:MAG: exodeoxyribonuclease III [Geminicoccaceae bacterium]